MEINEFIVKNGRLVTQDDRQFNAEQEAALVKYGNPTYNEKFRYGCKYVFDKIQRYKVLTTIYDNDIFDLINSMNGRITSIETDNFEEVMKAEGLEELLGKIRIQRITFETKTPTNGAPCDPCEC